MSDTTAAAHIIHMVNAHEERIQRLESVQTELASSVAELSATMQAFSQQMSTMGNSVCEKLEDVSTRLSDKIGSIAEVNKELSTEAQKNEERLVKLETNVSSKDKSDDASREFWRKIAVNVISAMIGAAITLGLAYLKSH